jgi:hypothetical protein
MEVVESGMGEGETRRGETRRGNNLQDCKQYFFFNTLKDCLNLSKMINLSSINGRNKV